MNKFEHVPAADIAAFQNRVDDRELAGEVVGDKPETPILMTYFQIAWRRRWAIIGSVAICVILGLIITLLMTPQFTARTLIEISRDTAKVVKTEGVEQEVSPIDMEFYQTQYGLLQSRSLAERVARDIKLVDDPRFFEIFGAEPSGAQAVASGAALGPAGREDRVRQAGSILLANIGVGPIRSSRLVEISFISPDAALSQKVVNAWGRNFIEANLERRFDATAYARQFLERRLEQVRQKLEESERALVGYASNQRLITVTQGGEGDGQTHERPIVADDLTALNQELSRATVERIRAESRLREARGQGSSTEALTNTGISTLRARRAEVAADRARALEKFGPDYPEAKELAAQQTQLDRSIAREESRVGESFVEAYRASLARERAVGAQVEKAKASLLDFRRRSIQYNIFQRDVDTNRELYNSLLQRYKEVGVSAGVGTNNVAVVDTAELPRKPSRPRVLFNLLISLVAGLFVGAALAFALEQIDEAISDPRDVERRLGLSLLGTIPQERDLTPAEAMRDRKSAMSEAYLSLQTNLDFATSHGAPKSICVTSTRPGEGKSTTAYAIASTFARSGRKVILIDGDMRSPTVHNLMGSDNSRGLSNFLTGNDDLAQLIRASQQDGLNFMPAGPNPPNAAELLSGPRVPLLIERLIETFDNVVIDSPPVIGLADAPLIANRVEATVYAVEAHVSRSSMVVVALDRLRKANAHLVGIVLTKFNGRRANLGYGYDYGYGYGSHRAEDTGEAKG